PIPTGQGITWQVISTGEPLMLSHATETDYNRLGALDSGDGSAPHSLLAVPVRAGQDVIGAISVQRVALDRPFTQDDLELLTTIAANIGVSLDNNRLTEGMQRRIKELAALNTLSAVLTGGEPLNERLR